MGTDSKTVAAERPGVFARLLARLKTRIRKVFGKKDEPNIYPFF